VRVPDLAISCTADAPGQQALPDPIVLIEILSPSNARETWDNVWPYTTIPSVREIAVVPSTRMLVELLRRGADSHWPEAPEDAGPHGRLHLRAPASPAGCRKSTPRRTSPDRLLPAGRRSSA
jgi:hypothetical protein